MTTAGRCGDGAGEAIRHCIAQLVAGVLAALVVGGLVTPNSTGPMTLSGNTLSAALVAELLLFT